MKEADVELNLLTAAARLGVSQQELAAACGLTYDQWRYRMRDPERRLEISVLRKAAKKLDTTAAWLIGAVPSKR